MSDKQRAYVGSRLRVDIPLMDVTPSGLVQFDPTSASVVVYKPDGTVFIPARDVLDDDGTPYIEFAAGELDTAGDWVAHVDDNGYKGKPIEWRVFNRKQ